MEESEEENPHAVFESQTYREKNDGVNSSTGPMNISEIQDQSIKSHRGERVRRTRQGRKNKESKNTNEYL